ncbi:ABC transporter permease [Nocardiopsis composta]|uniref:Glycine betaine/proline transport system permease protein n=1 Tax=Nocardiopsis composta TaxID=157465 RepID=A0A7W8VER1_9ACTN|nr:ABC transporter permease subunit [Nocardiopsis composta]MBB5433343.1 glycine betaine/proline transport system permease protein [Nocardiopsis composta]
MATETTPRTAAGPDGGPLSLLRRTWVQVVAVFAVLLAGYAALRGQMPFPGSLDVGLGALFDDVYAWIVENRNTSPLFLYGFNYASVGLGSAVILINQGLTLLTPLGVIVLGTFAAWRVAGTRVAAFTLATFALFGLLDLWEQAMTTLSLITTSVLLALLIGIPLGIVAGRSPRFERALRPVLDFMQIMPAFAYLMPMLLLFGIGNPAAAVATTVYAIPPAVRITALAIRGVDKGAVEAAESLGSTRRQILAKVQLPLAKRTIMLGVNQTIMLAVSMVVIASVIGAGGLGDAIYQALNKVDVGRAFEAGLAIVLMAIALDRITAAAGDETRGPDIPPALGRPLLIGGLLATAAAVVVGRLAGLETWPREVRISISEGVNAANTAMQDVFGGFTSWLAGVTLNLLLDPLRSVLTDSPWWLVVLAAAALGMALGGWRIALVGGLSILGCGLLGAWEESMDTLSQVVIAALATVVVGFVIGVLASRSDRLAAVLRPILDAMQTLPPFVYLIPAVALFGIGRIPALAAAVVYALPPVIRLVNDGIRGISENTVEAAESLGSTRWQMLLKVQLPLARHSLLLAVNQGIMMVLAMVVIGALVGAGALGYGVVFGMAQNQLGLGMTSGLAIVCLGLFLDRLTQSAAR